MKTFTVKKPVHSFRDLEVYQKTMEASVVVAKNLKTKLNQLKYSIIIKIIIIIIKSNIKSIIITIIISY